MEPTLKSIKSKRTTIKAQLTIFESFVNDFIQTESHSNLELITLQKRLDKIEPLFDRFVEIITEINCLEENDEYETELREFENKYFNITLKATSILESNNFSNSQNLNSASQNQPRKNNITLPTITLPTFDGTFTQWREFKDKFVSIIGKDEYLSNIQKLTYLKSSLKGEPAELLCSLETADANYSIAWSRLTKRYDNKRRIVNNHIQAILNFPIITRESYQCLRNLITTTQNHVDCLKTFELPVDQWHALLVPILASKLDNQTNKMWEAKLNKENNTDIFPTFNEFIEFLNIQQSTLEATASRNKNDLFKSNSTNTSHRGSRETKSFATIITSCDNCNQSHLLQNCESFLKLDEDGRNKKARDLKVCLNCLRKGHFSPACQSLNACRKCKKRHHTLLHFTTYRNIPQSNINSKQSNNTKTAIRHNESEPSTSTVLSNATQTQMPHSEILLSTAKILCYDNKSKASEIRILLDSASQSNFITQKLCNQLNLKPEQVNFNVKGINNINATIHQRVNLNIKSLYNEYTTSISCLVIPSITTNLPLQSVKLGVFKIPPNIKLADPTFNKSGPIDMLIGASMFYDLLCVGQIREINSPTLQKTKLGWVVSGNLISNNPKKPVNYVSHLTLNELHNKVEKFWQAEEISTNKIRLSKEEQYCENLFQTTTTRDVDGKFIVRIPFNDKFSKLGDSTQTAKSRFLALERRLNKDPILKKQYSEFINEYISSNHMSKISQFNNSGFYLPHHPVINNLSETTKLRVVFDGSCNLDEGIPINETQCTGPTIQDDLIAIISRFRTYKYVVTADIAKMYRQVWIHPDDRKYQRIIWRSDVTNDLETFELNTVSYGTSAAPFLAIRSLTQLAIENKNKYPVESQIIQHDFYVDDLLTGSNSITELNKIKSNIIQILQSGGFELRKWTTNSINLYNNSKETHNSVSISEKSQKLLGVHWNSNTDMFSYGTQNITKHNQITKRTILSETSQLFDPLGFLAPILIVAKFIIQDIWKSKVNWDESISLDIQTRWLAFRDALKHVNKIKIPRIAICVESKVFEIHAFSDASERGYGACVYLRSFQTDNTILCSIFAAKSRVASVKFVTLPRLELCAAVVAANLVNKVKSFLNFKINREYFWCDSQIVLCWLKSEAANYKTYVANRVTQIQELTNPNDWNYVKSKENPADLISRGVLSHDLINLKSWWHGPDWLSQPLQDNLTHNNINFSETIELPKVEQKNIHALSITAYQNPIQINAHSSINKLTRIVAYCLRFINNCKKPSCRNRSTLSVQELNNATTKLIKLCQRECFPSELRNLENKNPISVKSSILSLTPFLDLDGVIRVGGRIQFSDFPFNKKHPIILPKNHHFTTLIFQNFHQKLLHAGPKLLLNTIRDQFWPVNGLNIAKKIVRSCIKCVRFRGQSSQQLMGNLPRERLEIKHPFHSVGVDYAGPFLIKDRVGRGNKVTKAYICLFICFSTKAIHLELVSDLTTSAFIALLRRFISRRGKPNNIYSDNGTTFVGANKELINLGNFIQENSDHLISSSVELGIQWHFIPPYSPHFGGIWEAGVKSTKFHLKRILSDTPLTFEEFATLLAQIESLLNSRPLYPLSHDPTDIEALTPAHFLIGRPFTSIPEPEVSDMSVNRLTRFEHLQKMTQHFWNQWSTSYVSELQRRHRWKTPSVEPKLGALVLLKGDNTPPARWLLGRIIILHPGKDNRTRVVTVKCAAGEVKRSLSKICVLPIN